jgi:flagellar basal-body rod protein FlgB
MLNKIDQHLSFVNTALNLRSRRQEVLAANLANADTPHYKARDIDFAAALRSAMGSSAASLAMSRTSAGHFGGGSAASAAAPGLQFRAAVQPSLDGNSVDPDVERAHFAENAVHYQFLLERARGKFDSLKQAIAPEK